MPPMTAGENVAMDDTLVELNGLGRTPDAIRFLRFSPRCVLLGFHQAVSEEIPTKHCIEHNIHINRRIAGGGAILFEESQLGWEWDRLEEIAPYFEGNFSEHADALFRMVRAAEGESPNMMERATEEKMDRAWRMSRQRFGDEITFYLPGMFRYNGISGKYPAVSITGEFCALRCEHCRGSLLKTMPDAASPHRLLELCRGFKRKGHHGVLISGGCDERGHLPWKVFVEAIARVKQETGLYITVHCGLVDRDEAGLLKEAGVDQALLDVIGDDDTYRTIYHVDFGVSEIARSMGALHDAGLDMVPHVVCGLHYGEMRGEKKALDMIASFEVPQVVIVALMPPSAEGGAAFHSPSAREVADVIAEARIKMPDARVSLGCARKRGTTDMELMAIRAGVNRIAIPSDEAVSLALELGLKARYQRTCCSVSLDVASEKW